MNIQSICEALGNYGCLAFCYMYIKGIPFTKLIENFDKLVSEGIIDKECTVLLPDKFYSFFGISAHVSSSYTPPENKLYVAKWEKGGYEHFVVMMAGKVVFNPLDYSHCVSEGKIAQVLPYRIVEVLK